jgi:tetratricopeptide (TPR) repeat protein
MVSCKHCSTQNSLDSTFCKRCGTSIEEAALTDAQTKLDGLIEEGNALFNQGRTEEAMAVAEACVLSNPASVAALSLKTLCHERRGEIAEALECADRIVDLNPDSELDKIKRNALRTRLQVDLRVPEAPDRRVALVGAVSAVVLVACLGVGIARITSRPTDNALVQRTPNVSQELGNTLNPGLNPSGANLGATNQNPPANPNPNPSQPANNQVNGNNEQVRQQQPGIGDEPPLGTRNNERRLGNDSSIRLPDLGRGDVVLPPPSGENEVPPVQPTFENLKLEPSGGNTVTRPKPTPPSNPGEEPTVIRDEPPKQQEVPVEDPNKGIVISVRSGGGNGSSGRAPGGPATVGNNGLEMLQRVGTEQYQLGNYGPAARNYEQALSAGGDPIVLNQRIAQSYSRLGRNSEAAEAYRRCIAACDSAIANGRGNRARHESVKATAEQALKVLQGG